VNKEFFQSIFNQKMGYVYYYTGSVPEGESRDHYITEQFAQAAGTNLVNTVVAELPNFGITVIYNHSDTNTISSPTFELMTDLVPDPIPESPVVEIVTEETPAEEPPQG
jgi:hypothetical protein